MSQQNQQEFNVPNWVLAMIPIFIAFALIYFELFTWKQLFLPVVVLLDAIALMNIFGCVTAMRNYPESQSAKAYNHIVAVVAQFTFAYIISASLWFIW